MFQADLINIRRSSLLLLIFSLLNVFNQMHHLTCSLNIRIDIGNWKKPISVNHRLFNFTPPFSVFVPFCQSMNLILREFVSGCVHTLPDDLYILESGGFAPVLFFFFFCYRSRECGKVFPVSESLRGVSCWLLGGSKKKKKKKGRTGGRGGVGDTVFRGQGSRIVQRGGGVGVKEDGLLRISSVGRGRVTC